jgi:hypothetical protein
MFTNANAAVSATVIDAKGDLLAGTAADTLSRLAVGANNTVLTADSAEATGMKWAAAAGGANFTIVNPGGTTLSGAIEITVSGITAADKIFVTILFAKVTNSSSVMRPRMNGQDINTFAGGTKYISSSTYSANNASYTTSAILAGFGNTIETEAVAYFYINGASTAGAKVVNFGGSVRPDGFIGMTSFTGMAVKETASTVSSVGVRLDTGTFVSGTMFVYKSA